jgi:hypothetical protein
MGAVLPVGLAALLLLAGSRLCAEELAVVAMQTAPEQMVRFLRFRSGAMPASDCTALNLWECHADEPKRMTDISLRWVQLDDDADLEAILVAEADAEDSNVAYVFDKRTNWNLVGRFFCRKHRCELDDLIRVQRLTLDSPPLAIVFRDLGGSGHTLLTAEAFHLRGGKLWKAFQVTTFGAAMLANPFTETRHISGAEKRVVIHTIREEPPGSVARNRCEVWRWDPRQFTLAQVPEEHTGYCDEKTGKPLSDKSFPIGFPGGR